MVLSVSMKRCNVASDANSIGVWDVPSPSTILAIGDPSCCGREASQAAPLDIISYFWAANRCWARRICMTGLPDLGAQHDAVGSIKHQGSTRGRAAGLGAP